MRIMDEKHIISTLGGEISLEEDSSFLSVFLRDLFVGREKEHTRLKV